MWDEFLKVSALFLRSSTQKIIMLERSFWFAVQNAGNTKQKIIKAIEYGLFSRSSSNKLNYNLFAVKGNFLHKSKSPGMKSFCEGLHISGKKKSHQNDRFFLLPNVRAHGTRDQPGPRRFYTF